MIPIRDATPSRRLPVVTLAIIGLNVAVFVHELSLGPGVAEFFTTWGLVPSTFTTTAGLTERWTPVFTSMFVHGGWMHLIGNMLYLWIFGDNVEDRLGHAGFLLFYLGCGVVAALAQVAADPLLSVPTVGASGAVAGALGAYFILYPAARVLALVPLFLTAWFTELPAYVFLFGWFALQLLNGVAALGAPSAAGGVAWWAHAGGFAAGMVVGVGARVARRLSGGGRRAF